MKICVCISVGLHPTSLRERMAEADRCALELALQSGHEVMAIHAGEKKSDVLKQYLGMGISRIIFVEAKDQDPLIDIAKIIQREKVDLILTGNKAETGLGSGMFPYILSDELSLPVMHNISQFELGNEQITFSQIRPGGRRQRYSGSTPCVLVIANNVVQPRMSTFQNQRQGIIESRMASSNAPINLLDSRPVRKRGARLRPNAKTQVAASECLIDLTPAEAATKIMDTLRQQGLVKSSLSHTEHHENEYV